MQTVEDQTYNGWKNYPTWAVNLWLSNDEGLYDEMTSQVEQIVGYTSAREPLTREETVRYEVAEAIKNFVTDDLSPQIDNGQGGTETGELVGFAADLYGWALAHVDWYEIADAFLSE